MRTFDIPYVKQPAKTYPPPVELKDMSLGEIKKIHISTCAKANGDVSKCSKCNTPCVPGKRAIQLVANQVYNDPPVPLYGGKTLIERAQAENKRRREAIEKGLPVPEPEEVKKDHPSTKASDKVAEQPNTNNVPAVMDIPKWYQDAYNSSDPVKWIMDTFHLSRLSARSRVYQTYTRYPYLRETMPLWKMNEKRVRAMKENARKRREASLAKAGAPAKSNPEKQTTVNIQPADEASKTTVCTQSPKTSDDVLESMEAKINKLMALQDEYKKQADHYMKLYADTKTKVDALFEALSILNEE